jgi:hypothetical protein
MTNIAFFIQPHERGTAVAVYDYAHFNEVILENRSVLFARESSRGHPSLDRFAERFTIQYYEEEGDLGEMLMENDVQLCYHLIPGRKAHGQPDYRGSTGARIVYHCVFSTNDPAGDVYAPISRFLNDRNGTSFPVVPHMIHLPDHDRDMREDLGIPLDATVFGRHGGSCCFNVNFAHELLYEIVQQDPNIYFLFLNTDRFCESHPQIIHLPVCYDLDEKVRFINTCDAMLHSRKGGETFGIAVGEFSIRNKPVITFYPPQTGLACLRYRIRQAFNSATKTAQRLPAHPACEHINILGDKALTFCTKAGLRALLLGFDRGWAQQQPWDQYSEHYSPAPVMAQFDRIFIAGSQHVD